MRRSTIATLDGINRRFYTASAAEFDATRRRPWAGWERVVERYLAHRGTEHRGHSILDIGCGNGRFAAWLGETLEPPWRYLGLDSSPVLLSLGRSFGGRDAQAILADVVAAALPLARRSQRFDLIAVFGMMHHVPSWERRRSLLVELAGCLRTDGVLAVSFWQFGSDPRFAGRIVDWGDYNAAADEPIRPEDLETGDLLLRWGDGEALRYCHACGPAEAAELTSATGLARLETFRADGASGELNLYHLLSRRTRERRKS